MTDNLSHTADESRSREHDGAAPVTSASSAAAQDLQRENSALRDANAALVLEVAGLTLEVADHVLRIGDLELDVKRLQSEVDTLSVAVDSNRRIGAAVGILMHRLGVGEAAAFEVLKRASQATNTKLAAVAALVVETGEEPSATPSAGNSA